MFVVSYSYGNANPATLVVLPSVRIPNSTKQLTTKAGETEGKGIPVHHWCDCELAQPL